MPPRRRDAARRKGSRDGVRLSDLLAVRRYLTTSYMVTPRPLGQTALLTGLTNLVVEGTKDEAARVGRGGEKSAGADQSIANASTESRENEMRTMMVSFGGRQRGHRQRRR